MSQVELCKPATTPDAQELEEPAVASPETKDESSGHRFFHHGKGKHPASASPPMKETAKATPRPVDAMKSQPSCDAISGFSGIFITSSRGTSFIFPTSMPVDPYANQVEATYADVIHEVPGEREANENIGFAQVVVRMNLPDRKYDPLGLNGYDLGLHTAHIPLPKPKKTHEENLESLHSLLSRKAAMLFLLFPLTVSILFKMDLFRLLHESNQDNN